VELMRVYADRTAVNPSAAVHVIATGLAATMTGVAGFAFVHARLVAPVWTGALLRAPRVLVAGASLPAPIETGNLP